MIRCTKCRAQIDESSFEVEPITENARAIWIRFVCSECGTTGTGCMSARSVARDEEAGKALSVTRNPDLLDAVSVIRANT